jgi:hypothetical protein
MLLLLAVVVRHHPILVQVHQVVAVVQEAIEVLLLVKQLVVVELLNLLWLYQQEHTA